MTQLNWKFHISYLCNSLTKVISGFKLIKRLVLFQFKRNLYYAFSRISYGIEVYGTYPKSYLREMQVIQSRILKTLYNKDGQTHTNILHLLQIQDIFSLFQLTFVNNQQQRKLPETFSGNYVTRENIHSRATRHT